MIKVADSVEFSRLVAVMSRDVVDAAIHYRHYKDLCEALVAEPVVEAQSRTFWSLTVGAHLTLCQHLLGRVFDQTDKALHLYSWLRTIQKNLHFFDEHDFRERMKGNPYVDSLAEHPRKPDPEILERDIGLCSLADPLVNALWIHRGGRLAHRSAKHSVRNTNVGDSHPITIDDLEKLITRATEILNRYSNLFEARTYSTQIIGHDDYKFVLACVKEKVERSRRERRKPKSEI